MGAATEADDRAYLQPPERPPRRFVTAKYVCIAVSILALVLLAIALSYPISNLLGIKRLDDAYKSANVSDNEIDDTAPRRLPAYAGTVFYAGENYGVFYACGNYGVYNPYHLDYAVHHATDDYHNGDSGDHYQPRPRLKSRRRAGVPGGTEGPTAKSPTPRPLNRRRTERRGRPCG
ncbi:hypothetical protein MTO96_004839 [Rhipicephalus appendiculatus]